MNLKTCLFGTMFALAFTGCSSENPGQIDPPVAPVEEPKTTFNVLVNEITTKADTDESAGITSLQVLVFNNTANGLVLEKIGAQSADDDYQSEEMSISAGEKSVLVIANYPRLDFTQDRLNGTPLAQVLNTVKDFEKDYEKDGALTMNSRLYRNISITMGARHYLGFPAMGAGTVCYEVSKPVLLFRNVARVKLNSVFIMGDRLIKSEQYPGLQITLRKAYILHGKEKTMLVGQDATAWGSTVVENVNFINGYPTVWEDNKVVYMIGGENAKYASLPAYHRFFEGYTKNYSWTFDLTTDNRTYFDGKEGNPAPIEFYVYENPYKPEEDAEEIKTLLVLETNFSYMVTNPNGPSTSTNDFVRANFTRYYTVAVGEQAFHLPDGFKGIGTPRDVDQKGEKYRGVYRNLQYNIHLTMTGEGYIDDKGDKGEQFLQTKVEVAPWGTVNQYEVIE